MFDPSPTGFYDVHGNAWEWTEDHFAPLPDFEIHYLYDDFSTPCFDGWHNTILGAVAPSPFLQVTRGAHCPRHPASGGSWASAGDLASRYARYHFRRHFFQHMGFRYVVTEAEERWPGQSSAANLWEGQNQVSGPSPPAGAESVLAPPSSPSPLPCPQLSTVAATQYPNCLSKPVAPVPRDLTLGQASAYCSELAHRAASAAAGAGLSVRGARPAHPSLFPPFHLTPWAARHRARTAAPSSTSVPVSAGRALSLRGTLAPCWRWNRTKPWSATRASCSTTASLRSTASPRATWWNRS